jgi:hypothetical protein
LNFSRQSARSLSFGAGVIVALFTVMGLTLVLMPIALELREWIGLRAQKVVNAGGGHSSRRDCGTISFSMTSWEAASSTDRFDNDNLHGSKR